MIHLSKNGTFLNTVTHIQTTRRRAEDKDHEIIRRLVQITLHHCHGHPNPLAVHCTNGVKATGTFIAYFQLRDEFHDPK